MTPNFLLLLYFVTSTSYRLATTPSSMYGDQIVLKDDRSNINQPMEVTADTLYIQLYNWLLRKLNKNSNSISVEKIPW